MLCYPYVVSIDNNDVLSSISICNNCFLLLRIYHSFFQCFNSNSAAGLSDAKSQIMYEMSAPKLMLLQYNLGTGKQEVKEVKQEMENLIVMMKNVCDNYEVFEEGKDKEKVTRAKALLKDAKEFYKEAILNRV